MERIQDSDSFRVPELVGSSQNSNSAFSDSRTSLLSPGPVNSRKSELCCEPHGKPKKIRVKERLRDFATGRIGPQEGEGSGGIWVCLSPSPLSTSIKINFLGWEKVEHLKMLTLRRCKPNNMVFARPGSKPCILKFSWKTLLQQDGTLSS